MTDHGAWKSVVARFQQPSLSRATWQLVTSVGIYAALWCLIYLSLAVSFWLALALSILAGCILVRVFIVFHDCGHRSFVRSPRPMK
jgi:omega-6 fatty acid desaturase (delta-12 desaturase)